MIPKYIVQLKDGGKFYVVKTFEVDGESYAYLARISTEKDMSDPDCIVAKEEIKDESLFLRILTDEHELQPLMPYIQKAFDVHEN